MRKFCLLFLVFSCAWLAAQEKPASASTACSKTVSFAVAERGQPVPAIPKFVAKWIGDKKRTHSFEELCLSQTPSSATANYLVIFATSESSFQGLVPAAHTYTSAGPGGIGPSVESYGGTWSYSYSAGAPSYATNSLDLQDIDASKKDLVLRGYDQHGRQLFHYSVDSSTTREKLLEQGFADIHRDAAVLPAHKRVMAPLSVYYVNCDVDSPEQVSTIASVNPVIPGAPDKKAVPRTPPPQITLDLSSDPPGADIYLDDVLIGKTPLTTGVAPGEHAVVMRKLGFSLWDRRLHVATGPRRIVAHLERKFVNLSSAATDLKTPR